MTNLKDNIWIEGFDSHPIGSVILEIPGRIIYSGKTSEIPEEMAKECVESYNPLGYNYSLMYLDYKINDDINRYIWNTAKESIQSACNKPYCIIFKK